MAGFGRSKSFFLRFDVPARPVRFRALAGKPQNGPNSPPNGPKTAGPTQERVTVKPALITRYGWYSASQDPRSPAMDLRHRHRPGWGRVRPFATNPVKSCQVEPVLSVALWEIRNSRATRVWYGRQYVAVFPDRPVKTPGSVSHLRLKT